MSFDIYCGAGQNDITKGWKGGLLTINYSSNKSVVVTYQAAAGVSFSESHLYVGYKATTTSAPGQYGNQQTGSTVQSYQYSITTNGNPVYIVAHAVACGWLTNYYIWIMK